MLRSSSPLHPDLRVLVAAATALAACGTRDAVVGSVPIDSGAGGGDGATAPALSSEFTGKDGLWTVLTRLPGADVTFGSAASGASDGRAALLRLPGAPGGDPATNAGTNLATEIDSVQFLRFGTLRARVQFPTCAAGEEVAAAMFWFYNDGQDRNANGIEDNPEIDLHVLCGSPSFLVLTA